MSLNVSAGEFWSQLDKWANVDSENGSMPDREHCCSLVLVSKEEVSLIHEGIRNCLPTVEYDCLKRSVVSWIMKMKSSGMRFHGDIEWFTFRYKSSCPFLTDEGRCSLGTCRPLSCFANKSENDLNNLRSTINGFSESRMGLFIPMLAIEMGLRNEFSDSLLGLEKMSDSLDRKHSSFHSGRLKYDMIKRRKEQIERQFEDQYED